MNKTKISLKIKKLFTNHNMFATLIILATICSLCLSCANANNANIKMTTPYEQTVASSVKHFQKKAEILYEQKVGNFTNEQIDKLWPSNNPRSWVLSGTMDGEITKRYKAWHNRYKSQVKGTADERGLEDGTDLTIYIKNLNIKAEQYQDIRLIIDYLSNNSNVSLTHSYSMELYAIDNNHKKYGPFNVADFETTGFYMRKSGNRQVYERNFNIVSEHIRVPQNTIINELEIKPYANYPRICKDGKTIVGSWRGADSVLFEVGGIKIIGYKHTHYQRPSYIITKKINVKKTREKIVQRMYDFATIKWIPAIEFHDTRVVGTNPKSIRTTYKPGTVYYGLPYTQRNRVTLEAFSNHIDNGVLTKPKNLLQVWGADCASSVTYAISKYIPMHVIYNTTDFLWDRNKTTVLGNLRIDGKDSSTETFKEKLLEQELYEAYALLQKGDIVSTHHKKNTHVRLISGNTHVERKPDGKIDPDKSYFIRTDIRISQSNTTKGSNDFGGLINEKDSIVPFSPKSKYTDIKHLNELEGKNLNFYINRKETFREAYDGNYVPLTLNSYLTGTTEEPYAKIINANTKENIKNGLKGTIISNYTILSIKITIKDNTNGVNKDFTIYPDHNTGSLEGMYGNTYSLYYNIPQYIQEDLKETLKKTNDFEIYVSVCSGQKENIKLLSLSRNSSL